MNAFFKALLNPFINAVQAVAHRIPRLTSWAIVAGLLLMAVALLHPEQMTVVLWKLCLVTLAAPVSYWIDRALSPLGRPHQMEPDSGCRDVAMFRRSLVFTACVLGLTLGL